MSEDNKIQIDDNKTFINDIPFLSICEIMNSWEDSIGIDRISLEITKDLSSAAVLSRLRYWFGPSKKNGQCRASVRKDGKIWVARKDEEWWEECGVTPKQIRRIKVDLKTLGIVETAVFKFNNQTQVHWHLDIEKYVILFNEVLRNSCKQKVDRMPKGQIQNCPKGNSRTAQRDNPYNKNILHGHSSYNVGHKNKESKPSDVQLSLIYDNVEECFSCISQAYAWLINFGYKEAITDELIKISLPELRASVLYVRKQLKKSEINSSITGYLLQTIENKWYLEMPKKRKR